MAIPQSDKSKQLHGRSMTHLDFIKRRLLREAVHENAGTRPRSPDPGQAPQEPHWGRHSILAAGLALVLLFFSSAVLRVVAGQRGVEPWSILMTWVVGQGLAPSPVEIPPEALSPATAPTSINFEIFPLTVRKIALDPGHGGEDGGAVNALGLVEKDLTLDIARRLRPLLEQHAFEVLMTRQGDETVSLAQRAARANAGGADLFLSIHANWFQTAVARGPETYYLGQTNDSRTLQLVALENRPSGYSLGEYRQLLEHVYLDVRRSQSHLLARTIQRELDRLQRVGQASQASRGVKMAPFLVLVGTHMPAILTEIAYLSNQEEAQLLATPEYRQRIAQALWQGIRAYAATLNRTAKKGS
jgi:N-acetylmuramoyl-L-alanine amidase